MVVDRIAKEVLAALVGGALAWGGIGCEAAVEVEDGAGGGDPAAADGGPDASSSDGVCAEACAVTAASGCLEGADCVAVCERERDGWSPEVAAAFTRCVATNPLCYETLEGCMLGELHPAGTTHTVRLRGEGLHEHEGRRVRAWNEDDVPLRGVAVIRRGGFELTWVEPVSIWDGRGPLLRVYVDVDGDGACRPEIDVTEIAQPLWNGDLLAPAFEAVVAPPLDGGGLVCGGAG